MRTLSSISLILVLSAILAPGCTGEVETRVPVAAPAPEAAPAATDGAAPDGTPDAGGAVVPGQPAPDAGRPTDAGLSPSDVQSDEAADVDVGLGDERDGEDEGEATASGPATAPSCPPPLRLTPADVPPGYLPPVPVGYLRTVDGDTAHFDHPELGEIIVRFLYVNTEESHGDPSVITDFGIATGEVVRGYLGSARQRVLALRADPDAPGMPDRDVYDRLLGLVFVDGELFQTRLVREGLTPYYNKFGCAPEPIHSTLIDAEAEANDQDRGIWSPGHPLDYRPILQGWIARYACRPDPFQGPYCP